jgi:hypothetical protein
MIEPKELVLTTPAGEKTYILSKIPYASGGREVMTMYIPTALPKVGDYKANEELALKLMAHVGVKLPGGNTINLTTRDLINNHVPDFQTGIRLEKEMLEYNMGFFDPEKISEFRIKMAKALRAWITPILTELQQSFSKADAPASTNSGQSTP